MELCFWTVAFKTILAITKIPAAFELEPLNTGSYAVFIFNPYAFFWTYVGHICSSLKVNTQKANACSSRNSCFSNSSLYYLFSLFIFWFILTIPFFSFCTYFSLSSSLLNLSKSFSPLLSSFLSCLASLQFILIA